MITKNDCILLLSELQDEGIDCTNQLKQLVKEKYPSLDVLKFINSYRPLDATNFYEKLRKSYNNKKSKLYINIVKEKYEEPKDILITLSSLNLQILLFTKSVENQDLFLKQVRFDEITRCLYNYAINKDIIPCQKLLKLVKADLKCLEYVNGREDKE